MRHVGFEPFGIGQDIAKADHGERYRFNPLDTEENELLFDIVQGKSPVTKRIEQPVGSIAEVHERVGVLVRMWQSLFSVS